MNHQQPPSDPLSGRSGPFVEFVGSYLPQQQILHCRLNERITDKDVMKIAEAMTEWEIKLAVPLDLTRQEIADLNNEKRPQIQRQGIVYTMFLVSVIMFLVHTVTTTLCFLFTLIITFTHLSAHLRRRNVLFTWKDKMKAKATYGNLLASCLEGGDTPTAEKICAVLAEGQPGKFNHFFSNVYVLMALSLLKVTNRTQLQPRTKLVQ